MLNFIDFCSGIGGGRLGLERNGFKCLGFSEIDKEAIRTYKAFFDTKDECEFGDLTQICPENLPDFDLLISGFPCQTFSIVGKREGLKDEKKGQIIFYLAEILRVKKPKFFILENVKGILNHDKGRTIKVVLEILKDCGYVVDFRLLNSLDFGLPHARQRVYFVGIREAFDKKSSFFDTFTNKNFSNLKDFLTPVDKNKFDKENPTFKKYLNNKYNKNRVNLDEILSKNFLVVDTRQSDLRTFENKIPTLRRDRQGLLYVFENELYKISAIEALRLQGFGILQNLEDKILDLKPNEILKQCGNAMSVNVVEWIGLGILKEFCG